MGPPGPAGYYIGLEKGIYRKHGIDLTIITGGPSNSPSELLIDGRAENTILPYRLFPSPSPSISF